MCDVLNALLAAGLELEGCVSCLTLCLRESQLISDWVVERQHRQFCLESSNWGVATKAIGSFWYRFHLLT